MGWGCLVALLAALACLWWAIAVPFIEVRNALSTSDSNWTGEEAKQVVKDLGGEEEAARKLTLYLKMPRSLAGRRTRAVILLESCGENGVPGLYWALRDGEQPVRVEAAFCLGNLGEVASPASSRLVSLLESDDEKLAFAALSALKQIGPDARACSAELARVLSKGTPGARLRAIEALFFLHPEDASVWRALARVAERTQDEQEAYRAVQSLALAGRPGAASLAALVRKVGAERRQKIRDALMAVVTHPRKEVQERALRTIAAANIDRFPSDLVGGLTDFEDAQQTALAQSLGQVGLRYYSAVLIHLGSHRNSSVRQAARKALDKIKKAQEEKKNKQPVETPAK